MTRKALSHIRVSAAPWYAPAALCVQTRRGEKKKSSDGLMGSKRRRAGRFMQRVGSGDQRPPRSRESSVTLRQHVFAAVF